MVGDMIVNLYMKDVWRTENKFGTRRIFPSDKEKLLDFIKDAFPKEKGWVMEAERAWQEGNVFLAVAEKKIIGFACFDCSGKGYFGPFGVLLDYRGKGVGTELFYACLDSMRNEGYGYAVIGWVDDSAVGFYKRTADAVYIPNTEPNKTLYKRRVMAEAPVD